MIFKGATYEPVHHQLTRARYAGAELETPQGKVRWAAWLRSERDRLRGLWCEPRVCRDADGLLSVWGYGCAPVIHEPSVRRRVEHDLEEARKGEKTFA